MSSSPDGDLVGRLLAELERANRRAADAEKLLHARMQEIEQLNALFRSLPSHFKARGLAISAGKPIE